MRWREYLPTIKENLIFRRLSSNRMGSRPKELFDAVIEQLEQMLSKDMETIAWIIQGTKMDVEVEKGFESFRSALLASIETDTCGNRKAEFEILRDLFASVPE